MPRGHALARQSPHLHGFADFGPRLTEASHSQLPCWHEHGAAPEPTSHRHRAAGPLAPAATLQSLAGEHAQPLQSHAPARQ